MNALQHRITRLEKQAPKATVGYSAKHELFTRLGQLAMRLRAAEGFCEMAPDDERITHALKILQMRLDR